MAAGNGPARPVDPYVALSRGQQVSRLSHVTWRTSVADLSADHTPPDNRMSGTA